MKPGDKNYSAWVVLNKFLLMQLSTRIFTTLGIIILVIMIIRDSFSIVSFLVSFVLILAAGVNYGVEYLVITDEYGNQHTAASIILGIFWDNASIKHKHQMRKDLKLGDEDIVNVEWEAIGAQKHNSKRIFLSKFYIFVVQFVLIKIVKIFK